MIFKSIRTAPLYKRIFHPIDWFMSRLPDDPEHIVLDRKRIYIVPSRLGFIFAGVLLIMILASINYQTNLGFLLTFLLASMVMVVMLHTFRNLRHLHIQTLRAKDVFMGENIFFPVLVSSRGNQHFYSLAIESPCGKTPVFNLQPGQKSQQTISCPTKKRGKYVFPQFRIFTLFPFGLFYSWCLIRPTAYVWVYPKASTSSRPLPLGEADSQSDHKGSRLVKGNEDFFAIRDYQKGDRLKQIAWKALAKGQALQSKEFVNQVSSDLWLDEALLNEADTELKLSQLCRWILDAEQLGLDYGLRLKHIEIPPDHGKMHQTRCLQALAAYPHG